MWPYLVFKGLISAPPDIYLRFKGGAKTRYPKYDRRSTTGIMRFLGRLYFVANPSKRR